MIFHQTPVIFISPAAFTKKKGTLTSFATRKYWSLRSAIVLKLKILREKKILKLLIFDDFYRKGWYIHDENISNQNLKDVVGQDK